MDMKKQNILHLAYTGLFTFTLIGTLSAIEPVNGIRSIKKLNVPGNSIEVTITLEVDDANKPSGIIVEEILPTNPSNWTASAFTPQPSTIEPTTGAIKWLFYDASIENLTITYLVEPPQDACGSFSILGNLKYTSNGENQEILIQGDGQINLTCDQTSCLSWLGFLGGGCPSGAEQNEDVHFVKDGTVYIAGCTESEAFPNVSVGPCPPVNKAAAYIVKMQQDGELLWSRLIDGSMKDTAIGTLSSDSENNVIISGRTFSSDFPIEQNAFDISFNDSPKWGGGDGFLSKLSPQGEILWSTYLGGGAEDKCTGTAIDNEDNIYVTGVTLSGNFPVLGIEGLTIAGSYDGFLAKFNKFGQLIWSRFIGGSDFDYCRAVCTLPDGNVAVCGNTRSLDFPSPNNEVHGQRGGDDVFIICYNDQGGVNWSVTLAGAGTDIPESMASSHVGELVLTGSTTSTEFPTVPIQSDDSTLQAKRAFLTKLGVNGNVDWSKTFGGTIAVSGIAVAIDDAGRVAFGGSTFATDLGWSQLCEEDFEGNALNAFFAIISPGGNEIDGAFLGGSANDTLIALSWGNDGALFLSGHTNSPDFLGVPCGLRQTLDTEHQASYIARYDAGNVLHACRTLPICQVPGEEFLVTIQVQPPDDARLGFLEEYPPQGWMVGEIGQGGEWDPVAGRIAWDPEFIDPTAKEYTYSLTPPINELGQGFFKGTYVVDNVSEPINCDEVISLSIGKHPSDSNDDWKIEITEASDYLWRWLNGEPFDVNVVTVSWKIWKRTQCYELDNCVWWKPITCAQRNATMPLTHAESFMGGGEAYRYFENTCWCPGSPVNVSIEILPKDGVEYIGIEEVPPLNWVVTSVDNGGVWTGGSIRWLKENQDQVATRFSYQAVPPNDCVEGTWHGEVSFDGSGMSISGSTSIGSPCITNLRYNRNSNEITIEWCCADTATIQYREIMDNGEWQSVATGVEGGIWTGTMEFPTGFFRVLAE